MVGNVTSALRAKAMWEDTLIVLTADSARPHHSSGNSVGRSSDCARACVADGGPVYYFGAPTSASTPPWVTYSHGGGANSALASWLRIPAVPHSMLRLPADFPLRGSKTSLCPFTVHRSRSHRPSFSARSYRGLSGMSGRGGRHPWRRIRLWRIPASVAAGEETGRIHPRDRVSGLASPIWLRIVRGCSLVHRTNMQLVRHVLRARGSGGG